MKKERKEVVKHHIIYCNSKEILEEIKRLFEDKCGEIADLDRYRTKYRYFMDAKLTIRERARIQELYKMYVKRHYVPYGCEWFIDEY